MPVIPEGVELKWTHTPEEIKTLANEIIQKQKKLHDELGAMSKEDVNLENFLIKCINEETDVSTPYKNIEFYQHVSADKAMREASTDCDKLLSEMSVDLSMRQDVFDNSVALQAKGFEMTAEQKRYLERDVRNGKRNGLHLSPEIQDEVKAIKKEISELEIEFSKNLNEENTILEFTADELDGLPEDFIKELEKTEDGKKLQVSLKYPHYFPCMRNAKNPETRQKLMVAFYRKCIDENTKILEKLVELRHKKAVILGYANHSDYVTEILMSKSCNAAKSFLEELGEKLKPLGENDRTLMLKLKKEECSKVNIPFDDMINSWDMRYYMNMIEKEYYSVDHEKIKEYFPMEIVTKGLLEIYQELLSLKFELIPDAEVWHSDVTMYKVIDVATNELMGYFYLDLYPRDGKFGHAACFGIQPGCLKKDGTRMMSIAAMVANLPKPTADKPSLLTHDDVETFFHEFGHVMHDICGIADIERFTGTNVERDFVEAPSQMLENWIWEKEALKRISHHYQDNSKMPDNIIEALIKSRNANTGVFNLRQILLAMFDITIHTQEKANTSDIYSELSTKILGITPPKDTNMPASFGHMCGYDSRYYGYMWSEVFSMDMFTLFKRDGIFNQKVGLQYRNQILKPGGSIDASDIIRNFLGREPNDNAFLIAKGLQIKSALQD